MCVTNIAGPFWRERRPRLLWGSALYPITRYRNNWFRSSANPTAREITITQTSPRRTRSSRVHQREGNHGVHSLTRNSAMTMRLQRLSNWPVTRALSNDPLTNYNLHLHSLITLEIYLPLAMLGYTHYRFSKRIGYSLYIRSSC